MSHSRHARRQRSCSCRLQVEQLEGRLALTSSLSVQNGLAPEYVIALANELHSEVWLQMPHMAADDYVREYAQFVNGSVKPAAAVHVAEAVKTDSVILQVVCK